MFRQAIDRYAAGADLPLKAIEGLSHDELLAHPVPGTWSIQELVVHLYDSDLVGCDRMKRVAAMDRPLLIGYDQDAFIRTLGYDRVDAGLACEGFRLNRLLMAAVLRHLPDSAAERAGIHSERGRVTLLEFVRGYAEHLEHHLKFLREKRVALGKPM
jgi:hypothetical protein